MIRSGMSGTIERGICDNMADISKVNSIGFSSVFGLFKLEMILVSKARGNLFFSIR